MATGATLISRTKVDAGRARIRFVDLKTADTGSVESAGTSFKWNVSDRGLPLLGLPNTHLTPGLDQSLSYPLGQFSFPIFQALNYDDEHGRYLLPSLSKESKGVHFIEFAPGERKNTYTSIDGANLKLIDNDSMKVVRTSDGTRYIFVRYPDGEFRCASIKDSSGAALNLLYTANGLMLHGLVDSSGRTITFNYAKDGINSVTQTWMANSEGLTKTWMVGDQPESPINAALKFSHAVSAFTKALPANAVVRQYTAAMAASDKTLAHIFGGPNASPAPMDSNRPVWPSLIRSIAETSLATMGSNGADISRLRCTSMEVQTAPATLLCMCRRALLNTAARLRRQTRR